MVKGDSCWSESELKHEIKSKKENESVEYGEKQTMIDATTIRCGKVGVRWDEILEVKGAMSMPI